MPLETHYTSYDDWAWLYNQSEAQLALQGLLPLLEKLLLPSLPEHGQILDLCCGTGQVAQQLTLKGYQVTGVDSSEKMLHYARENISQGTFILEDVRSFKSSPTFDAAICTDSSLNHMMSLEELKQVFCNVYAALKEKGLFLFDLGLENRYRNITVSDGELQEKYAWIVGETYNPEDKTGTFTITVFQPTSQKSDPKIAIAATLIQRLKCLVYNRALRQLQPSILLQLINKDWKPSAIKFSVKPYTIAEVQAALTEVGFTQVGIYDFRGKVTAPTNTQYAYFMARKPGDGLWQSRIDSLIPHN
ncbi:MAG: class I SAM-dependent methyltransferase [Aphanocapsa sp. GSE-SYN-MK-11-07L]|jgi:SAM-dependent methyltransferase|nr:class I SAM-dependent methyltransferase [Aphanocapsa sp. GSE-SYN-MK-11-07L]